MRKLTRRLGKWCFFIALGAPGIIIPINLIKFSSPILSAIGSAVVFAMLLVQLFCLILQVIYPDEIFNLQKPTAPRRSNTHMLQLERLPRYYA